VYTSVLESIERQIQEKCEYSGSDSKVFFGKKYTFNSLKAVVSRVRMILSAFGVGIFIKEFLAPGPAGS
jgi:hypothetical protein